LLIKIKKRMRITITIDVDGQGQVSINAGHETTEKQITETAEAKPAPTPKAEPKAEAKPAPAPKAEAKPEAEAKPAPASKAKPAQASKAEPAQTQEESEDSAVTLDDIREAAKEKINKHRDAIKAKLAEYGANNISSLSPEYFEDFYVFLSCELK
jgi:hypothetical protein